MSPSRKTRRPRTARPSAPTRRTSAARRAARCSASRTSKGSRRSRSALDALGFEIVSTGGTAKALRAAGIAVTDVATITGFPEIMDGRVKTLHPHIHGGLLARRGVDDAVLASHGIGVIELLVVNLYPFEATTARPDCTDAEAIENIDVGGPAMLRAAAKNHEHITVVVDHADYDAVLAALEERQRAGRAAPRARDQGVQPHGALRHARSAIICARTARRPTTGRIRCCAAGSSRSRCATAKTRTSAPRSIARPSTCRARSRTRVQLQGKELSFNNLVDADAALQAVKAFEAAACVIVKHANPCGVATAATPVTAYQLAYRTDPTSAFGGVIAFNRPLDQVVRRSDRRPTVRRGHRRPRSRQSRPRRACEETGIRVLETGWPTASSAARERGLRAQDHRRRLARAKHATTAASTSRRRRSSRSVSRRPTSCAT